jgi:hypothetical protein
MANTAVFAPRARFSHREGGLLIGHRFAPRVPVPLIAIAGAVAASAVWDFAGHGIEIIGPVTSSSAAPIC